MFIKNKQSGFFNVFFIIVAIVIIMWIIGFDLRGVVDSEIFKNTSNTLYSITTQIYEMIKSTTLFITKSINSYIIKPVQEIL